MKKWRKGICGFHRRYALLAPLTLFFVWWMSQAPTTTIRNCIECGRLQEQGIGFMMYAPHSGFSNQVGELRNAIRIAALLNRTLVIPPVTDHHALSLGSCPKYRIVEPADLRSAAWSHISDLIAESRYYSIIDIVNISSVSPNLVKTIDLRVFALLWCNADIRSACSGPVCHNLAYSQSSISLRQCASLLQQQCCVYGVNQSCATTVWTYRNKSSPSLPSPSSSATGIRVLLSKELKTKKFSGKRQEEDIYENLGRLKATVVAFGSLFSADYQGSQTHIDFEGAGTSDEKFNQVLRATEFFPLTRGIMDAAQVYIERRIKQPFLCAQLRLLDGQFKNHWSKTFGALKSRLEYSLKYSSNGENIQVFVMTDLGREQWRGTYLEELGRSEVYGVHLLDEDDEIVVEATKRILKLGYIPNEGIISKGNILLYIEQAICSCASLGFQGTLGSTITNYITQMRNSNVCK